MRDLLEQRHKVWKEILERTSLRGGYDPEDLKELDQTVLMVLEKVREEVEGIWEFLDEGWEDNMANRMEDGRQYLEPKELEKAKEVMLPMIKTNIADVLTSSIEELKK